MTRRLRPHRRDGLSAGRRDRFGYWFDNHLASGTRTRTSLLGLATLTLVVLAASVIWIGQIWTSSGTSSLSEGFWSSLLRTLDPGTMGSDNGWPYRLVSLGVTIGGILIVSALIGLVATGLDQRLTALRQGHLVVVERGHALVLGWTPKLFTLLGETERG